MAARKPKGTKDRAKPKPAKPAAKSGAESRTAKKPAPAAPSAGIELSPRVPTAEVTVTAAKGRPMLTWVGKRALERVTAFPAQHIERFDPRGDLAGTPRTGAWKDWPDGYAAGGLLFHGDNKEVLAHLLASGFRGKVKLIYIDPPFDSGADYVRKVSLRGAKGTAKLDGVSYSLGEQVQYTDIWANDNYLQFMYERLILLRELLAPNGVIWVHCDWHKNHHLRMLLDEVMGDMLLNEIVWQRTASRNDAQAFGHVHDTLYYYGSAQSTWHAELVPHTQEYLDKYYNIREADGRRYAADNLTQAGLRTGLSGRPWRGFDPAAKGVHWKFGIDKLDELDTAGRIYWPTGGEGFPRIKRYLDELEGRPVSSIWSDVFAVNSQAEERGDYPTQKPEALLERIVRSTSSPGDLVLDCFIGSGTTAAVAQKLGRRWIGCDINKGAIQTTAKRLQGVIGEQLDAAAQTHKKSAQGSLLADATSGDAAPAPAQHAFTVWRVNDYDLQIQHNEAVNLACEHLGVTRNRADGFFDGTRGQNLVKIIPFGHPLSPLDLDEIRRELDARPDETRSVTVVSLGIEAQARLWVDGWNRTRRGSGGVNAIDVIELRTDERYGRVIRHEPAKARVSIARKGSNIHVAIKDFVSPSILERLAAQAGVLAPDVDDWRCMVDCVMIDPAWNGNVFNVALSDIPERKTDLVAGDYELPAPSGATAVAVKIIDMLGEEVIISKEL